MTEFINYLEFPARDLDLTKAFFNTVFGWIFTDYGPDYTAYEKQGLDFGFYRADKANTAEGGGVLAVFLTEDLPATQAKILAASGVISTETFKFPGGERFHFIEPSGNEFAVWRTFD